MRKPLLMTLVLLTGAAGLLEAQFAYVGNAGSYNVSGYTINASTGALTPISGSPFPAATRGIVTSTDPRGALRAAPTVHRERSAADKAPEIAPGETG